MFIRTFLVGLLLIFKAARAYVHRNQDGLEEHTTGEEMAFILNAVDALTDVINLFAGNSFVLMGSRTKPNSEVYVAAKNNLREIKAVEPRYVRTSASVKKEEV